MFDCQSCGACCVANFDTESYVHMTERDVDQFEKDGLDVQELAILSSQSLPLLVWDEDLWSLRTKVVHELGYELTVCVLLKGVLGAACRCQAYDSRPQACRDFKPGSEDCLEAREAVIGLLRRRISGKRTLAPSCA